MKTFIHIIAIVMAVVVFLVAGYTIALATTMCVLSSEVAEAELTAQNGTWHDREDANRIYQKVTEVRKDLYNAGGYTGWFTTTHKLVQVVLVLASCIVLVFYMYYVFVVVAVKTQEKAARKARIARYKQYCARKNGR